MAAKRMRQQVLGVVRVDPSSLAVLAGLRCSIGFLIPLVVGAATGHIAEGVSAATGAMEIGFISFEGRHRATIFAMAAASFACAFAAFLGATIGSDLPIYLIFLVGGGFLAALFSAFGSATSVAALQPVVILIVFSSIPMNIPNATAQGLWVLAGCLLQILLVVVTWPFRGVTTERKALADVYRELARYANSRTTDAPGADQLLVGTEALADPNPLGPSHLLKSLSELLSLAEEIRLYLSALVLAASMSPDEGRSPALSTAGDVLERIGAEIENPGSVEDLCLIGSQDLPDGLRERLKRAFELSKEVGRSRWGKISLKGSFALFRGVRVAAVEEASALFDWPLVKHAIRLAAVLMVGTLVARSLGLGNGYWVPMTALVVVKGDFTGTVMSGAERIVGTLVGAGLVTFLAAHILPGKGVLIVVSLALAWGTYTTFRANYSLYSVFLTSTVVVMFALLGSPVNSTALERVIATVVGGGVALVLFVAWPTWKYTLLPNALSAMISAQSAYASEVLSSFGAPEIDPERLSRLAARARATRHKMAVLLDEIPGEPRYRRDLVGKATEITRAINRSAQLALSVQAELYASQSREVLSGSARTREAREIVARIGDEAQRAVRTRTLVDTRQEQPSDISADDLVGQLVNSYYALIPLVNEFSSTDFPRWSLRALKGLSQLRSS